MGFIWWLVGISWEYDQYSEKDLGKFHHDLTSTTSRRDLTGIMGSKGNYPKIALIQVSELLLFAQICMYIYIYIYIHKHLGYSKYISNNFEYKPFLVPEHFGEKTTAQWGVVVQVFLFP